MRDPALTTKTKQELIDEVTALKQRVAELETVLPADRDRAEDLLRVKDERLRLVTDNIRDIVLLCDPTGIIQYVSPSAQDVCGLTPDEMIGTPLSQWLARVHPDDQAQLSALAPRRLAAAGIGHSTMTYRFQHSRGNFIWLEQIVNPFNSKDGSLAGFTLTLRDITERVVANEHLQRANERFLKAFHDSPIGISISTLNDGRYIDVNQAFVDMYGFQAREELIGNTAASLGTWADITDRESKIQLLRDGKLRGSFPYSFRRKTGELREALCAADVIDLEGEEYILSMFQDISDLKRAEDALRESEQRFRLLVENSPAGIYMADDSFHLLYANPRLAEIIGYTMDEIKDRDFRSFIAAEDLEKLVDSYIRRRQGEDLPTHFEFNAVHKDGNVLRLDLYIVGAVFPDGQTRSWGQILDVTERRLAEEALQRRDALLEALEAVNGQLLRSTDLDAVLPAVLARFGPTIDVSRITLYENQTQRDGVVVLRRRCDWTAPGVESIVQSTVRQNLTYPYFEGWYDILAADGTISGLTRDFPPGVANLLRQAGTLSTVVVPVFCGADYWGLLTFADVRTERAWLPVESEAMRNVASNLGVVLLRQRSEHAEHEQRLLAEALRDTSAAINSSLHIDEVLERILVSLNRVLPHDAADVMLIDHGVARIVRSRGYVDPAGKLIEGLALSFRLDEAPYLYRAIETRQVQIISDVTVVNDWLTIPVSDWIRSYMVAPITVDGQVIGFINLNSAVPDKFTSRDAEWLRAFTDQAGVALRNARLYDTTQHNVIELETLRQLALDLTAQLDPHAVMRTMTYGVLKLLNVENCGLYRYSPENDDLELVVHVGGEREVVGTRIKRGEGLAGKVLDSRTMMMVDDYEAWSGRATVYNEFRFGAVAAVPIIWQDEILGVLDAMSGDANIPFSAHQAQLLSLLASQAAIAIRNAQVFSAEQEQRSLAEALRDSAAALSSSLDLKVVITRILENVGRVVPHVWSHILLIEDNSAHLAYHRGWSPGEEAAIKAVHLPLDAPGIRELLPTNAPPVSIPDTAIFPGWIMINPGMRSYAGAAIRVRGQTIGSLELFSPEPGFFTPAHAERLQAFADQAAVAIENAQLYAELQHYAEDLQKRVELRTAELHRAKEHVEAILNSSSDAVFVVRENGTISQVNPAFNALFGYQPDEVVGQNWHLIVEKGYVAAVNQAMHELVADKPMARMELEARRKDGTTFSADMGASLVKRILNQPEPIEVVCSLHDITSLKRAEAELRRALAQEKELSELQSRFVSTTSHDFRTPLTVILSSTDLLDMQTKRLPGEPPLDPLKPQFARIRNSVKHMTQLIDDMLTIRGSDSHKLEVNLEQFDLEDFCLEILQEFQLTAGPKHALSLTVALEQPHIKTDRHLLRQVLVNLLTNAVKYSPKGGPVRLNVHSEAGIIAFEVTDEGMGIPEKDQARLFESFHRASNVGGIQGTGLGLAITKRSVDALGGTIDVDSRVGIGTTFIVSIPAE